MKSLQNYYIGLDIGTSSVGWAVTDEKYNIPKFNGKKMWGVRLFEEAKTSEERRAHRSARRRLYREKERINLLQEFFAEEVSNVDPNFFLRLKNSDLYFEDKNNILKSKNALFNDSNYKDKDYFRDYPTIHHLIMDLIENDEKKDIRLIYLACHYLIKNRGHFIFEGKTFNVKSSFERSFNEFRICLETEYDEHLEFNNEDLINILVDKKLNKTTKSKQIESILGKSKILKGAIKIMVGGKQKLSTMFDNLNIDDSKDLKIDFTASNFDEEFYNYEEALGEQISIIKILKDIYDASILEALLNDAIKSPDGIKYISSAFIHKYNQHKEDLKKLKKLTKKHLKDEYFNIFKKSVFDDKEEAKNYVGYINSNNTNNRKLNALLKEKKKYKRHTVSQRDFLELVYKKIILIKKKFDTSYENDKNFNYELLPNDIREFIKRIDQIKANEIPNDFMPKMKSSSNGIIPYQLKSIELKKILENQSKYYNFLKRTDQNGSVSEKILSIMEFKIPYYIGPLNAKSKFSWIKRDNNKITPWNFSGVVDIESTRKEFINRLIGRCTYIKDEKVLPKSSLLYEEFMILNELNNLKLNGITINEEIKNKIFNRFFKNNKKVTLKTVSNFIKSELNLKDDIVLSGTDGDFKHGWNTYIDFKNILAEKINKEKYVNCIEEIVTLIVLYDKDKKELEKKIKSIYKGYFSDNEIKRICSLNYKDWGRLSRRFLIGIKGVNITTGESGTIMHFMREYCLNLMELMSSNFTFREEVEKVNGVDDRELCYEMVDELYVSPPVKRMLWQSLKIVDEIRNILKHDPEKIFIEMARDKEKIKKRTKTRKDNLLDFYKSGKNDLINLMGEEDYKHFFEEIKQRDESSFKWDNLYFYYTQLGRCMYSLEPINIDNLNNRNIYDQDHIYPKSKIYDDSIENRVLVKKELNTEKSNTFPIPNQIINPKAPGFWKALYEMGLIGKKKYARLIRKTPFTKEELTTFIERQIVETRQATKETATLLKTICKDSDVVYSKGANVSRFRNEFNIVKCRSVNDLHHMHDAYLNIVVGNVYNTKFTNNPANFVMRGDKARGYNLENMFKYDVKTGDNLAWKAYDADEKNKDATIIKVKKEIKGTNFRLTRMSYFGKGELFDQQLLKKGYGQISIKENSIKSDINKYGGYNGATSAYFCLVESTGKKGKEKSIETIPIIIYNQMKHGNKGLDINYLEQNLGLKDPKILFDKIKINSLFRLDGFYYNIRAKTGVSISFAGNVQLLLNNKQQYLIKRIDKFLNNIKNNKNIKVTKFDGIEEKEVLELYKILVNKLGEGIYSKRKNNQYKNIVAAENKFLELDIENKLEVISQILLLFQASNNGSNLTLIGLSKASGKTNIPKKVNFSELKIINQSITGLFENEVDLLKI